MHTSQCCLSSLSLCPWTCHKLWYLSEAISIDLINSCVLLSSAQKSCFWGRSSLASYPAVLCLGQSIYMLGLDCGGLVGWLFWSTEAFGLLCYGKPACMVGTQPLLFRRTAATFVCNNCFLSSLYSGMQCCCSLSHLGSSWVYCVKNCKEYSWLEIYPSKLLILKMN